MLLSDWYLARQEKRIQTAVEEAAKAEGLEEGIEQAQSRSLSVRSQHGTNAGKPPRRVANLSQSYPPVCHKMVQKDKDYNLCVYSLL